MSFNKAKVLEDIQKYIQKGQIDKAIEEYERILRIDPKDFKLRQKLGDLYLRKGKKNEAINQYLSVADTYIKDGFYFKAIAIYRQIIRTDPNKLDIYEKLADLYKKLGLTGDALTQLKTLAEIQEKQKNLPEAINTWEKIISYDPDNVFYRGKIVEFYLKQGLSSRAAEKLQQSIDYLKSKGKIEDVEKLLSHFPGIVQEDKDLSFKIALSLYETGKYNDAINKLDILIKQNPKDPEYYSLKGYCYLNMGNYSLSRACFENAIKFKNDHIDARKGLAKLYIKQKDFVSLLLILEEMYEILKKAKDYEHIKSLLDSYFPYFPEEEKIIKLYIDLANVTQNIPLKIEYLKKLGKLYVKNNDQENAEKTYQEILKIDPYEESAVKFFEKKEIEQQQKTISHIKKIEQEIPEDKSTSKLEKEIEEVNFLLKYGLLKNAKDKLEELKINYPDSPIIKEKWVEYFENTKDFEALKLVYKELIDLYSSLENEEKKSFYQEKLKALEKDKIIDKIIPESEEEIEEVEFIEEIEEIETESLKPNLEDLIIEANYKFEHRDLNGARELCNKILEHYPYNTTAKELLASIDQLESEKSMEKQKESKEQQTDYFDLSSEIMKELESEYEIKYPFKDESERITFENLFKEFKEKLSQKISSEDVETHYNLGIAYKEMGLYDDAIGEFLLTSKFDNKSYDSFIMIATCFSEKGDFDKATLFYKKALELPNITNDKKAGIYFELGNIYEKQKSYEKAYLSFKKAYNLDLNLKIAQSKIEDLLKLKPELSKINEAEIPY